MKDQELNSAELFKMQNEFIRSQEILNGRNNSIFIPKSYRQINASKLTHQEFVKRKKKAKRTTFLQKLGRKIQRMFEK